MKVWFMVSGFFLVLLGIVFDVWVLWRQFDKWGWYFLVLLLVGGIGTSLVNIGTKLLEEKG